jgi:diguanylate cyclase (GGDEF)-like protein
MSMVGDYSTSQEERESSTVWGRLKQAALSLQFRATALVVILMMSVAAAASGYLLQSSVKLAQEQHKEQLIQLAAMLAKTSAQQCAERDSARLRVLAREAADGMPLLYVVFTDLDGLELASARHGSVDASDYAAGPGRGKPPVVGVPTIRRAGNGGQAFLDMAYPVNLSTGAGRVELVGYMRTGMTLGRWHQTMSSKLDLVVGVGSLATGIAVVLGFFLIRRIISPLEGLAQAMAEFSQGNLTIRSPVGRRDEIGRLAVAFNRMADQHQHTHERIIRLNIELEERVNERTAQLRELAARDFLTGLYNRRHFNEVLERSFSEAIRYEHDLSCIMLDLDDFKAVNDAYGHQVGDKLIVLTAGTISSQLRAADVAARYGGDEFIVLLPQTGEERARVLAKRIVDKFAKDVSRELPHLDAGMSSGIASLQHLQIPDAESLVRSADHAMYEAKAGGKNQIVLAGMPAATISKLTSTAAEGRG